MMKKGAKRFCGITGMSKSVLEEADEKFLTHEGEFETGRYPDCDLFNKWEIAKMAGSSDDRHFVENVITHPGSPFHFYEILLVDSDGRYLNTVLATHTNSAQAGKRNWEDIKLAERIRRDELLMTTECNSAQAW